MANTISPRSGKKSLARNKARKEETPILFLIWSGMFGNISLQRKASSGQKRVKQQVELQHLPVFISRSAGEEEEEEEEEEEYQ